MPYFRYDPKFAKDPWEDLVRDLTVDSEAVERGADGSLALTFEGNRIDVIAAHTGEENPGSAKVLIDDRPPLR